MFRELLDHYAPYDENEEAILRQLKQFLEMSKNPFGRDNLTGHIVADAWIVNKDRTKVVLVEHGLNHVWCAPGGHCDGSDDVLEAARREAMEEAGLDNLLVLNDGEIFDLNSGTVPLRRKDWGVEPAHIHYDICFAFEAPDEAALNISHESSGLKWVNVADIPEMNYERQHLRRVEKTLAGLLTEAA